VNGDEVRDVRFPGGIYGASQVDDLLGRIAVELDAGRPAEPLIAGATFRPALLTPQRTGIKLRWAGPRGYDSEAVDWFLDQLRRQEDQSDLAGIDADPWRDLPVGNYFTRSGPSDLAEPTATPSQQERGKRAREGNDLAQECADAWHDFGQQPGARLRWVRAGVVRHELRTAEQQTVASLRDVRLTARDLRDLRHTTLSSGGRTFTWKQVTRSAWPGVAEIVRRSHEDNPRGYLADTDTPPSQERQANASSQEPSRAERARLDPLTELLDQTGTPILYTSGDNYQHYAEARITFTDQRLLCFPVRGTTPANAIMTAVDQAGNKVARYRATGKLGLRNRMEITVHPRQLLTDELALALVIAAPWLWSYFLFPSQGGGG
jgi:DivIVA domain-containing protein